MIEAMFSPAGGISAEIMRTIGAAKSSVDIAAFSFTSTYIANVIKRICKKPGMKVQIVFDKDFADKKTSKLDELLCLYGAKTRKVDLKHGSMHHKFIIVDNIMLFTGSYNFTNDAERNNYENVIKTDIPEIVAAYREEFKRVWAIGRCPEPFDHPFGRHSKLRTGLSKVIGNALNYQGKACPEP